MRGTVNDILEGGERLVGRVGDGGHCFVGPRLGGVGAVAVDYGVRRGRQFKVEVCNDDQLSSFEGEIFRWMAPHVIFRCLSPAGGAI